MQGLLLRQPRKVPHGTSSSHSPEDRAVKSAFLGTLPVGISRESRGALDGDELKSTDLPPHPRRVRALLWLRSIDPTAEPGMRRDDPAGSGVGGGCGGCGAAVQPCRAQAPAPGPSAGIRLTWD